MSVIEQQWANYSKLKYDLAKEYTKTTESHAKELSHLKATLSQSGLAESDPQYSLRIDKLMADQSEAQNEVLADQQQLESGAIMAVLKDPYYGDSHSKYAIDLATKHSWEAGAADRNRRQSLGVEVNDEAPRYNIGTATEYLKSANVEFQDLESFYSEKFGEYAPSAEEVHAEKSSASMAQARGVSGGQRSKQLRRPKSNVASTVGGNMFLGISSSTNTKAGGWWS